MSDLEQHILDKYGPVLGTKALHELMRYRYGSAKEVCNAISREQFPIPTYKDGRSRVANYRDVARHLESVLGMAATTVAERTV